MYKQIFYKESSRARNGEVAGLSRPLIRELPGLSTKLHLGKGTGGLAGRQSVDAKCGRGIRAGL